VKCLKVNEKVKETVRESEAKQRRRINWSEKDKINNKILLSKYKNCLIGRVTLLSNKKFLEE
jgi:hypothetical protein